MEVFQESFSQQFNNNSLRTAVNEWINNPINAEAKYGHISTWDVSQVTQMNGLFKNVTTFNENLDSWDVSNVTNMYMLFYKCVNFNNGNAKGVPSNLNWDVNKVKRMDYMFNNCKNISRMAFFDSDFT